MIKGEIFWHRILSVHDEGPVGKVGVMQPDDFLLEVFYFILIQVGSYLSQPQC